MTYEELLALAKRSEGKVFRTVTGKEFTVGIFLDCPFFTPASTGLGRSDGRRAAELFLERYNSTLSHRPSDYRDICRNATYFIGLIADSSFGDEREELMESSQNASEKYD